jgi:predicted ribosomally synthesized peptide with nif11-like leader
MSKAAVEQLIEKLNNDEEFRNIVMAVKDLNERMKLIKEAGFDCVLEEIEAVQAEQVALTDDELDKVSGGKIIWT